VTRDAGRDRIVSDTVWIVVATTVAQVVTAVTGILIKRLLGPADVAAWALGSSVLGYLALTQLGVLESILLRVPLFMARRGEALCGLVTPAVSWILLIAIPATVGVLLFAVVSAHHTSPRNLLGLALILPLIVPFQFSTVGVTLARARGDFRRLAVATVLNGLVTGLLGLGLVYLFGLVGQGVAFGLGLLTQVAIFAPYGTMSLAWRQRISRRTWRTARAMIRYGFPFQSGSAVLSVRQAIDTVLAVFFLGPLLGGVYALAASFRTYLVALPTAFGTVLYRALRTHHGVRTSEAGRPQPSEWWITAMAANFLTMVLPGSVIMSVVGPPMVAWFLPRFVGAPVLVAVVPIAAATMMMEPVPLQRLLASGATRQFRFTSVVALGGAVLGSVTGLALRSALVTLLGVAAGAYVTLGVAMHLALRQSMLAGRQRGKVWAWCTAGFIAIVAVSAFGLLLQDASRRESTVVVRAIVTTVVTLASFGAGAVLARRLGRGRDG